MPEIKQIWKQVSLDLSESVRDVLDGGTLRDGNLLNAFVIWCCLQPEAERLRIAKFGLKGLEMLKSRDSELDLRKLTLAEFGKMIDL